LCRSRRELSNEYLLAKIGVDTAENEPLEVWGENSIHYSLHSLIKLFSPLILFYFEPRTESFEKSSSKKLFAKTPPLALEVLVLYDFENKSKDEGCAVSAVGSCTLGRQLLLALQKTLQK
jgi:hypothetical protein